MSGQQEPAIFLANGFVSQIPSSRRLYRGIQIQMLSFDIEAENMD
jgi:hypothetical protein